MAIGKAILDKLDSGFSGVEKSLVTGVLSYAGTLAIGGSDSDAEIMAMVSPALMKSPS